MGKRIWKELGFIENPYSTDPLKIARSDVDLLMGRTEEQVKFLSNVEISEKGVCVLSGVPGVGKTSFINVQMYLLESEEADFGPKLLSARNICFIQPSDEPMHIAIRCVQSFCKSIKDYCDLTRTDLPEQTEKIYSWVYQNKVSSFNVGVYYMGTGISFGREIKLPLIKDVTYETLVEVLTTISYEVKETLEFDGSFIVLDNMENLFEDDLSDCLITFRDTLFTIPYIWWVLIGQSGLSSLISTKAPKVFQRLSGDLELEPIIVDELINAVNVRVERFHENSDKGSSPISRNVYTRLFESSNGEIRFVFKYCNAICLNLIQFVRNDIVKNGHKYDHEVFHQLMGHIFVNKHIDDSLANERLKEVIAVHFRGLNLSAEEKFVLQTIGGMTSVSASDFKKFKLGTQQKFVTNYLVKLRDKDLLYRRQEGRNISYELRGLSLFALDYGMLDI